MAIIDFFYRGWLLNRHGTAYIMDSQHWTFDETYAITCQIGHGLVDARMAKQAKGAVLAGNHPLAWMCVLGMWRAGLAWVPLNPRSAVEENLSLLQNFDTEVLFFQSAFALAIDTVRTACPGIKHFICIDDDAPGFMSLDRLPPAAE